MKVAWEMASILHWQEMLPKSVFIIVLAVALFRGGTLAAQDTPDTRPERIFIANGGGDFGLHERNYYPGKVAQRAYDEFFAGMEAWGYYQIVANPARADWIFEIRTSNKQTCTDPQGPVWSEVLPHNRALHPEHFYDRRQIELVMMDTKTFTTRKYFAQRVEPTFFESNPEALFDRAVANLIKEVKDKVGEPRGKTKVSNPLFHPPVPPAIGLAHTVFISSSSPYEDAVAPPPGVPSELTEELSAALRNWGRYTVVNDRANADLLLQISFAQGYSCLGETEPQLTLAVEDARTGVLFWSFLERRGAGEVFGAHGKPPDAMKRLVKQLRDLAETRTWELTASTDGRKPVSPAKTQKPASAPNLGDIRVSISTPQPTIMSGAAVHVTVRLHNASRQDLDFAYVSDDPLTCVVAVRDASGKMVDYSPQGLSRKQQHENLQGPLLKYALYPGETQTRDCDVAELYNLSAPGKYSMEIQQLDGTPVRSNTVTVSVVTR